MILTCNNSSYSINLLTVMNTLNLQKMCELLMTHNGCMFPGGWVQCICRDNRQDIHKSHCIRDHFYGTQWEVSMDMIKQYCKQIINKEILKGYEMKDMKVKLYSIYSYSNATLRYANTSDEVKYDFQKGIALIPYAIQELEYWEDKIDKIIEKEQDEIKKKMELIYDL